MEPTNAGTSQLKLFIHLLLTRPQCNASDRFLSGSHFPSLSQARAVSQHDIVQQYDSLPYLQIAGKNVFLNIDADSLRYSHSGALTTLINDPPLPYHARRSAGIRPDKMGDIRASPMFVTAAMHSER